MSACIVCKRKPGPSRFVTPFAVGGTTRPVCSDCRLMPTIETVVLKRLLLEQIAEQGDGS